MAVSMPRSLFGIHELTLINRDTAEAYGKRLQVLDGTTIALEGEQVDLIGGSSKWPWDTQVARLSGELTIKTGEFPSYLWTLFLGKTPTDSGTSATGSVTTLTNVYGTSLKHATTGVASIGLKSGAAADLKYGKYVVKVASATTVRVYAYTGIDFLRGDDLTLLDDSGQLTAAALTITTGGVATEIPDLGVELIGGSGAIGMTTGDTATFEIVPPASEDMDVIVGSTTNDFPEFGAYGVAQRFSDGRIFSFELYRCKGIGLPLDFASGEFVKSELKARLMYDSALDAVFRMRHVNTS